MGCPGGYATPLRFVAPRFTHHAQPWARGLLKPSNIRGSRHGSQWSGRLRITDKFTEKLMGKGFSVSLPLEEAAIVEKEANRLGLPAASIIRLMMRDGQQRRELERQVDDLKARMELLQVQFQGLQILLETIALEQANARGPQALENRKALIQEIRKRQGLVEG